VLLGADLPTLLGSGCSINLVDRKRLMKWRPGIDYQEMVGDSPKLHGLGPVAIDERRNITIKIPVQAASCRAACRLPPARPACPTRPATVPRPAGPQALRRAPPCSPRPA
jgi:hypothetical protein